MIKTAIQNWIPINIYRNRTEHIVDFKADGKTFHLNLSNKNFIILEFDGTYEGSIYIHRMVIDTTPLKLEPDVFTKGLPIDRRNIFQKFYDKYLRKKYIPKPQHNCRVDGVADFPIKGNYSG